MAASTNSHARICLTFDSNEIESSWLLVKYKEMPLIHDVCQKINSQYSLVRSRKEQLVLRLQSSVLPTWESSELLQNDDRISVSVERLRRSNDKPSETDQVMAPEQKERKKRRRETSTEQFGDLEPEEKRKKECAERSQSMGFEDENVKDRQEGTSSTVGDMGCVNADQIDPETIQAQSGETEIMQVESNTDEKQGFNSDSITSETCIPTKKRKRIRKHRKKKTAHVQEYDNDDHNEKVANIYKGREIGKDELFFGSIPDKLVTPKHYRHEYRNLNVYKPEPSKHTKFDSDEDVDSKENTEQYNFLSSTRLLEEREAYKDACEYKTDDSNALSLNSNMQPNENQVHLSDKKHIEKNVNQNDTSFEGEKESEYICKTEQKVSDSVKKIDTEVCNGYHSDTINSNGYSDFPFKYPNSEPKSVRKVMNPTPVQLTRKTLSSGASVFVRQRPGRKQQQLTHQFEMSKEDQLNSINTNISTIFVNPVRTGDNTEEKAAPIQSDENKKDNLSTTAHADLVLDYSKLLPLKGELKKGDKIVYKILEISETCTPEISDYREAVVMSVDKNQMVELKNLTATEAKKNIFHVEVEDEHEVLTNTASSQRVVQLHLSSLLDIRVVEAC